MHQAPSVQKKEPENIHISAQSPGQLRIDMTLVSGSIPSLSVPCAEVPLGKTLNPTLTLLFSLLCEWVYGRAKALHELKKKNGCID